MKALECKICGNRQFTRLYKIRNYEVVQCNNCKIIFSPIDLADKKPDELLGNIYQNQYFTGEGEATPYKNYGYQKNYFLEKEYEIKKNSISRLVKIEKLAPQKGRLLDIGCAAGFFLQEASQRGWDTTGLDVSPLATAYAREKLGLNALTGTFENITLPENHFDVVTAWDVIEHVLDPGKFVKKAFAILKPGGLLMLGTPNVGSLASRLRKEKWIHLRPPEHIFFYDPASLEKLLLLAFQSVAVEQHYPPYSRIQANLKAVTKRILYTGFNIVAKIVHKQEYLIAYGRKS